MIVLDTNVLSALIAREPERRIVRWLDGLPSTSVWLTAISVYEVVYGISLLAVGARRRGLEESFRWAVSDVFENRVLQFDAAAAEEAGRLAAARQREGRTIEIRDVQIAGIARARKATLATRNTRHFTNLGFPLVDPWTD